MFKPFFKKNILIAHRGYRAYYPENTLYAFKAACGRFDMFEFDVQYTRDMVPVVFHDENLFRCTDVKKIYKKSKIEELTYEEVKNLDNVSWFVKSNPFNVKLEKNYLKTLNVHAIPTLDEVLEFIKETSFAANLEIKNSSFDETFIIKDILDRIEKFSVKDLVIISSFNHGYIEKIDGFYKAALFDKKQLNLLEYLKRLNVDAYHVNIPNMNVKDVEILKKENIFTNVYTVNDKNKQKELFFKGVKGVFCDY